MSKERRGTPALARGFLGLLPIVAAAAARGPAPSDAVAAAASPVGDEITENWPAGGPHKRYKLDPDGKLQGEYTEWWESGKVAVRTWYEHGGIDGAYASFHENGAKRVVTRYRRGKLNGAFAEFADDGKPLVEASYDDGALDGKRTLWRDGAPASRQLWRRGELLELGGAIAHPRPLAELRAELAEIRAQTPAKPAPATAPDAPSAPNGKPAKPDPKAPKSKPKADPKSEKDKGRSRAPPPLPPVPAGYAPADDPLWEKRFAVLKRLQEYRLLANVAWRDVVLVPAYDFDCDRAGNLLEKVGHLDHTPANPGVPDDEYRDGYRGTSNSNLHYSSAPEPALARAIDGFMDDSDADNIARVGHRRHCLHPLLQRTGFGWFEHYSALWALDRSRPLEKLPAIVTWPPAGWASARHFEAREAWHCSFFERKGGAAGFEAGEVRVFATDADYVPAKAPLALDFRAVEDEAVIFRPVLEGDLAGRRFWVEIDDPSGEPAARYLVEFAAADAF